MDPPRERRDEEGGSARGRDMNQPTIRVELLGRSARPGRRHSKPRRAAWLQVWIRLAGPWWIREGSG
jgi:hypothetical protein